MTGPTPVNIPTTISAMIRDPVLFSLIAITELIVTIVAEETLLTGDHYISTVI